MQSAIVTVWLTLCFLATITKGAESKDPQMILLPTPRTDGSVSLEQAIAARRSIRDFSGSSLPLETVSQLLWAGQGVTSPRGLRASPSAGATFPIFLYVLTKDGVYRYLPDRHALESLENTDRRGELAAAAVGQEVVREAPLVIVIVTDLDRITPRYGDRAWRYSLLEAGHIAQNIILQATVLDLGMVPVGAFQDEAVSRLLNLPPPSRPCYILPIGCK